jgi:hypothetical protein
MTSSILGFASSLLVALSSLLLLRAHDNGNRLVGVVEGHACWFRDYAVAVPSAFRVTYVVARKSAEDASSSGATIIVAQASSAGAPGEFSSTIGAAKSKCRSDSSCCSRYLAHRARAPCPGTRAGCSALSTPLPGIACWAGEVEDMLCDHSPPEHELPRSGVLGTDTPAADASPRSFTLESAPHLWSQPLVRDLDLGQLARSPLCDREQRFLHLLRSAHAPFEARRLIWGNFLEGASEGTRNASGARAGRGQIFSRALDTFLRRELVDLVYGYVQVPRLAS